MAGRCIVCHCETYDDEKSYICQDCAGIYRAIKVDDHRKYGHRYKTIRQDANHEKRIVAHTERVARELRRLGNGK